jgi:hypothetical protein
LRHQIRVFKKDNILAASFLYNWWISKVKYYLFTLHSLF